MRKVEPMRAVAVEAVMKGATEVMRKDSAVEAAMNTAVEVMEAVQKAEAMRVVEAMRAK